MWLVLIVPTRIAAIVHMPDGVLSNLMVQWRTIPDDPIGPDLWSGATVNATAVRRRMSVICADGRLLGIVDHVDGDTIKIASDDGGGHYWIPNDWVITVDDKVHVDRNHDQAMREWLDRPPHTVPIL